MCVGVHMATKITHTLLMYTWPQKHQTHIPDLPEQTNNDDGVSCRDGRHKMENVISTVSNVEFAPNGVRVSSCFFLSTS